MGGKRECYVVQWSAVLFKLMYMSSCTFYCVCMAIRCVLDFVDIVTIYNFVIKYELNDHDIIAI